MSIADILRGKPENDDEEEEKKPKGPQAGGKKPGGPRVSPPKSEDDTAGKKPGRPRSEPREGGNYRRDEEEERRPGGPKITPPASKPSGPRIKPPSKPSGPQAKAPEPEEVEEIVVETPPAVSAPAEPEVRAPYLAEYTVVAGDNLSKISERFYGTQNHYYKIFQANKDIIKDPNVIRIGQVLKIPHLD